MAGILGELPGDLDVSLGLGLASLFVPRGWFCGFGVPDRKGEHVHPKARQVRPHRGRARELGLRGRLLKGEASVTDSLLLVLPTALSCDSFNLEDVGVVQKTPFHLTHHAREQDVAGHLVAGEHELVPVPETASHLLDVLGVEHAVEVRRIFAALALLLAGTLRGLQCQERAVDLAPRSTLDVGVCFL